MTIPRWKSARTQLILGMHLLAPDHFISHPDRYFYRLLALALLYADAVDPYSTQPGSAEKGARRPPGCLGSWAGGLIRFGLPRSAQPGAKYIGIGVPGV